MRLLLIVSGILRFIRCVFFNYFCFIVFSSITSLREVWHCVLKMTGVLKVAYFESAYKKNALKNKHQTSA